MPDDKLNPLNGKPKRERLPADDPTLREKIDRAVKWSGTDLLHQGYLDALEKGNKEIDPKYIP